jgi:hydroxyethylthiazole kinase
MVQAVALGKPWVLDPVGCGATTYRTAACVAMLRLRPTVVRGNASEILALAGAAGGGKGVDSTAASHEALDAAKHIARQHSCVVAVSGATDLVRLCTTHVPCLARQNTAYMPLMHAQAR